MKCPFCKSQRTGVTDSRPADLDDRFTRRRRECKKCHGRFTTTEIPLSPADLDERFRALSEFSSEISAKEWRQLRGLMLKVLRQGRHGVSL